MATHEYVAAAEFNLNLNNGTQSQSVIVRKGDIVFFDGNFVEHKGVKGSAPSLRSVVGNWIKEKGKSSVKAPVAVAKEVVGRGPGLFDVTDDTVLAKSIDAEMKPPFNTRKVINSDESEVARVSKQILPDSTTKNTSGVSIVAESRGKAETIHEDQLVVKETGKKANGVNTLKRAEMSPESEGVVVKKVSSAPAVSKTEVTEKTVVEDNTVSKPTVYEKTGSMDIGSSTQTRTSTPRDTGAVEVGSLKDLEKELHNADVKVINKRVAEHSEPFPKQSVREISSEQDGKVVTKTKYARGQVTTSVEGIDTTLTVGSDEVSEIVATTSSIENDLEAKVTFSGSNSGVTSIQQEGVIVSRGRVAKVDEVEEDFIDIQDILKEVSEDEKPTSIDSLSYEGVLWKDLHWKKKIQFVSSMTDKVVIRNILNGDSAKPIKTSAEKRLAELR